MLHTMLLLRDFVSTGGTDECDNNDIRLVNGQNEREGIVEVCYSGVWGTICVDDDYYAYYYYYYHSGHYLENNTQADVICRQLGLLGPNTSTFGCSLYNIMQCVLVLFYFCKVLFSFTQLCLM